MEPAGKSQRILSSRSIDCDLF